MKDDALLAIDNAVTEQLHLNGKAVMWLKIDMAGHFLDTYFDEADTTLVQQLKNCPAFWRWWRSAWAIRDKQLMARPRVSGTSTFEDYEKYHEIVIKGSHMRPPAEIIAIATNN